MRFACLDGSCMSVMALTIFGMPRQQVGFVGGNPRGFPDLPLGFRQGSSWGLAGKQSKEGFATTGLDSGREVHPKSPTLRITLAPRDDPFASKNRVYPKNITHHIRRHYSHTTALPPTWDAQTVALQRPCSKPGPKTLVPALTS
jgi:hypothetical protein